MKEYEKLRLNDCVSSEEEGMLFEQSRSHTREKRTWNFIAQYQWAIQVLLLLTIVGMMIERRWSDNRGLRLGRKYEFGGDVTGFAPKFDQRILKFAPDTRFVPSSLADFYNQDVQDAWLSIAPRGLGHVEVKNPEKYKGLPQPLFDFPDKFAYTTSVTHQIHCLYAIYAGFAAYATAQQDPDPDWHMTHCFDYLRQSIMCAGDMTLEGAQTTKFHPKNMTGSDGWDAPHVCRDYGQIYTHLDHERAFDKHWIGQEPDTWEPER